MSCAAWHLEVDMDVVPEHVHAEEPAAADLTGILLVAVGQQVLVHVAPAGEYLWAERGHAEAVTNSGLHLVNSNPEPEISVSS